QWMEKVGLIAAWTTASGVLGGSIYLLANGMSTEGLAVLVAECATLVGAFIYRERQKAKQARVE
ncbi:MAG: hypothetical protein AB1689_08775, partial [Thermodesulfobacteriota bacterium]